MIALLKEHHFALYQAVLAVIGMTAVLAFLFSYTLPVAAGYAVLTLGSYVGGQGLVVVVQRLRAARGSRSLD